MNELIRILKLFGACDMADNIKSHKDAFDMVFTPQGRDFCVKTSLPNIHYLRENKEAYNALNGVFIDSGEKVTYETKVFVAGDSNITVDAKYPYELFKVVCMHGAKVKIKASDFAVVTVTCVDSEIEIENDGTAKVMVE